MNHDFTTLANRYCFSGKLKLEHAAHIGSGFEGDEVDSTFTKLRDGRMYLPGSSIRGVLRSTVERILMTLKKPTCLLFSKDMAKSKRVKCLSVRMDIIEQQKKKYEKQRKEFDQDALYKFLENNPEHICHTCCVFGSTHFASKIKIADAVMTYAETPNIRFGTGINRETGTVQQGALYAYEVAEKDSYFEFELIAENMTDNDLGVLSIGLLEMISGDFWIGAKSAIGLGRCKLDLEAIKYFDGAERTLREYLLESDPEKKYLKKENKKAEEQLQHWVEGYMK